MAILSVEKRYVKIVAIVNILFASIACQMILSVQDSVMEE
jgi:hypothetical protein